MTYRIAHFSDFHLMDDGDDMERSLAMIDDAIEQDCDHILITGDVVECGEMDVYDAFIGELKDRGWGRSERLSVVPGNHDIFPWTTRKIPPLRTSTGNFTRLVEILKPGALRGSQRLVRGQAFPFAKCLNNDVMLIGVDTTRNRQYDPRRWAEGELPENEMEAVEQFLEGCSGFRHRLIAMHHHPWVENLYWGELIPQNFASPKARAVQQWLGRCGATLAICGHVHTCECITRRKYGACVVFREGTAGGMDENCEGDKLRACHLIDLHSNGKIKILSRRFWDWELEWAMDDGAPGRVEKTMF